VRSWSVPSGRRASSSAPLARFEGAVIRRYRRFRRFSHAEALKQVKCPLLLLQAHSFRHPKLGLVGAMDDADVRYVQSLAPQTEVLRLEAAHQIHIDQPRRFVAEVVRFASALEGTGPRPSPSAA